MSGARRVLGFMALVVFGCVLGILILDRLPTRRFDWSDYVCWGVCSVLIYAGFAFRAWTAACKARKTLARKRSCI